MEDAAGVMPVRVPEAMEATVVDSPAAAVAAILAGTSMVFEVVDVVDVVVVVDEVVLEVTS